MKTFVLANREHVLNDVKQSYKSDSIAHFEFKADMQPFLENSIMFARKAIELSEMGETIRIIIAGPAAMAYILGMTFAHSSRNVVFAYLDLDTKKYVDLDLSDHKKVHI